MKAFVLAAGKGERLKNLTVTTPKPMLTVKGEIILEHNLKWLKKNGFDEVYINLHYLADVIRNYFGDGSRWGVKITYSYEQEILGTAGAVKKIVSDYLRQDKGEDYLIIYGDNFYPFDYNLTGMVDFHKKKENLVSVGLYPQVNKQDIVKCGVALIDQNNLITDFIEKPRIGHTDLRGGGIMKKFIDQGYLNAAIYVLNKKIVKYIPQGFFDFGKDIFPELMKNGIPLYGYVFDKPLITIDTVDLYKQANSTIN